MTDSTLPSEKERARSKTLIEALGRVAAHILTTSDPDEVMKVLGEELNRMGIHCSLELFDASKQQLQLRYLSIDPRLIRRFERLINQSLPHLYIPSQKWQAYQVIRDQRPLFSETLLQNTDLLLPDIPPRIAQRLLRMVGISENTRMVHLPLTVEGEKLGVLTLWGDDLHTEDIPLFQIFASQVAATLDKTLLLVRERKARKQAEQRASELTILEGVSKALNRAITIGEPLDLALDIVIEGFDAGAGWVLLSEGDNRVRLIANQGFPDAIQESSDTTHLFSQCQCIQKLTHRELESSGNLVSCSRLSNHLEGQPPFTRHLSIPIELGGQPKGILNLALPEKRELKPSERRLLMAISDQFGVAIERARLYDRTHSALTREQHLNKVAHAISAALDLPTILKTVVQLTAEALGADAGTMALIGEDRQIVHYPYLYNLPEELRLQPAPRGQGLAWKIIETGESFILPDYSQIPEALPNWVEAGLHSIIAVPVPVEGKTIGALGIFSLHKEKSFSEADLPFIEAVARQAGVAIHNAHLFEAEQQRTQESETLRRTAASVAATLDRDEAIERILEQLNHVVPYDSASIQLLRDDHLEVVGGKGWPDPEAVLGLKFTVVGDNHNARVVQERRPVLINDTSVLPQYFTGIHGHIRSWLGVPLVVYNKVIGILTIDSVETGHFTEDHVRLASAFADQVAIALENSRLYKEAIQSANRLVILHRASQEINATLDRETLYQAIHLAAVQLMPCQAFVIALADEETDDIHAVYLIDKGGRTPAQRIPKGTGLSGKILETGKPLVIDDFLKNQDKIDVVHFGHPDLVRSVLAVPLKRADGKIFGVISAQSYQPYAYTKEDQEFLELLAAHAATALENTRLFAEVQKLATIDPLTGINNRRELFVRGRREFERAQRYRRPLSAIMLDLDHFKKVNDTYGHSIGDQVLTCVAKRCAHSLREVDILGRYGGEEFAILFPESEVESGVQAANRLRDIIRSTPCPTDAGPIPITISLGVAAIDPKCRDLESLLDRADQALYEAKQSGRDRVCVWKE